MWQRFLRLRWDANTGFLSGEQENARLRSQRQGGIRFSSFLLVVGDHKVDINYPCYIRSVFFIVDEVINEKILHLLIFHVSKKLENVMPYMHI
ncbi:MAG: hypothetical protein LBH21_07740, partial [Gracilibacteraceae bacterium]|nr:hypothetical protein [Gracilibacteraceae bacterium]